MIDDGRGQSGVSKQTGRDAGQAWVPEFVYSGMFVVASSYCKALRSMPMCGKHRTCDDGCTPGKTWQVPSQNVQQNRLSDVISIMPSRNLVRLSHKRVSKHARPQHVLDISLLSTLRGFTVALHV